MSGRIVTGALVATAVGIGVVVGLAAPRSQQTADPNATPNAQEAQLVADLATRDEWVAAVAEAAATGRIDGMRVVLLITEDTRKETVDQVTTALTMGGATVEATGRLGTDWWDPTRSSFRGELATQMSASIVGIEGLGATDVLEHAIVQAIVPGALPRGATAPAGGADGASADQAAAGATRQEVLLEVLSRAKILTLDHPAAAGVDALVIVTGEGPAGAGAALNAAATVWEQYLGATEIVVAGDAGAPGTSSGTIPTVASDAIAAAAAADTPRSTRPSVVVLSEPKLAAAEIIMALKEQATGGSGTYGTAIGLDIVAIP